MRNKPFIFYWIVTSVLLASRKADLPGSKGAQENQQPFDWNGLRLHRLSRITGKVGAWNQAER
jgi:hypothetical protein